MEIAKLTKYLTSMTFDVYSFEHHQERVDKRDRVG